MSSTLRPFRSTRGSVLLVALLLAALIAIALVSYLSLANNSLKQASRSFYASSGINLAETGLELAMARFNQLDDAAATVAWDSWTLDSTPYDAATSPFTPSATRTFTGFTPGPGATGTIKVFAQHYAGSTPTTVPKIVAKATITQDNAPPIEKYIEVILRKRSLFGDGLSALQDITVVGGSFEGKSWDSDPDNNPSTPALPYTELTNTASLTVGSVGGNISLGGGEIWGYAKVSDSTHTITGGSVHGLGETADDPDRRLDDFDAVFPMPTTPTSSSNVITATVNSATQFPRAGDFAVTESGKQVYYYNFPAAYSINLGGAVTNVLSVEPGKNVVFILNNRTVSGSTVATSVDVGGNASIQIGAGGTLNIYTDGNVNIAGGGLVNLNIAASSFMLWGTRDPATAGQQTMDVRGNGVLTGVIYAPNATLDVRGGGSGGVVSGAVVGKSVRFNGTTQFYYDEALADITVGNPYGASSWRELRLDLERAAYSAALNF